MISNHRPKLFPLTMNEKMEYAQPQAKHCYAEKHEYKTVSMYRVQYHYQIITIIIMMLLGMNCIKGKLFIKLKKKQKIKLIL